MGTMSAERSRALRIAEGVLLAVLLVSSNLRAWTQGRPPNPVDVAIAEGSVDAFLAITALVLLWRLGKIGLPIRVTEFNMPGQRSIYMKQRDLKLTAEQEQARAKALADYYRICFAHPAVEGILMWGFWEGANWIPQSSLYRRDWAPTPAAETYRDLVFKQWWTRWEGKADADGRCRLRAFYGKYAVTCGTQTKQVLLSKQNGQATIHFE